MARQTLTSDQLRVAVYQELLNDKALEGMLADIPYLSVRALPPGQDVSVANWAITFCSCTPEMAAAIHRAASHVQQHHDLATPFPGSSAVG